MKRIFFLFFVFFGLIVSSGYAQERRVSGTVTDQSDGTPLPGVAVVIRGTAIGTATDVNGRFELVVPAGTTLVFSFLGMVTQEVPVGDRLILNVRLVPDQELLDEVVVVGFGTRLRSEITGAISTVRAADIANTTQPSFESALQGRTAGIHVVGGSGKLGQAMRVRVRGASSITASSQPLYVIDGIPVNSADIGTGGNEPMNPMADINPADIESIQVLKDASASAIFGARAANGVVLITTRRGREGRTNFNFTTQIGVSEPANTVGFLNRAQYLSLVEQGWNNVVAMFGPDAYSWLGLTSAQSWPDALDLFFPYWRDSEFPNDFTRGPDENWENRALRRNASTQQYDLSVSGGTEKTRFFTSLSWADQESVLIGNNFDRASARLNLDHTANDVISFGLGLNPIRSRSFRVANDNAFATPLQMVALPPLDPAFIPGTDELNPRTQYENGLIPAKYNSFNSSIYRNIGNLFANINIMDGLTWRTEVGFDLTNQKEKGYWGRKTNDGGPFGSAEERTVMLRYYTLNSFITFDHSFADLLNLNFVGGMSYEDSYIETQWNASENFPSDRFRRISSGAEPSGMTGSGTAFRFLSFFSRANFSLQDRYFLQLSGRYDGSSRFGADHKFGFFPAASLSWLINREDFMQNLDFITMLRPRVSYGITGNSEIGNFSSRGLFGASNYAGYTGLVPISMPADDLRWETTSQFNVGLDFGLFNDRITGEFDYYIKNTTDLLLAVNVPSTSGFTSIIRNVGDLRNSGFEFTLNTVNLHGEFEWRTNFNISFNENEVTNLDGQIIRTGQWRAMEGKPIGIFWMPVFAGVDPNNGDALFYLDETRTTTTPLLSQAAHQMAGDPNPDFTGGLTNSFSWRGFDLGVTFQFVYGNDIFNGGRQWQADGLAWVDNQTVDFYENFWRNPGDNAKWPQPRFLEGNGSGISSMLVFDGSFIRLKDVTLGYNIRGQFLANAGITNLRVFAKALNLLTFTEYPGWDPEANFVGTGPSAQVFNLRQGHDFYTSPQPRTITFGVQIGF
ncbi:MAG TPA: SusC/RagA family TonB-linked outer membrane protein [Bacteroidales bacterium]|nr:SusC/RagA family TonB-linked outer membrane protein [Bacteroidales bacterium]